MVLFDRSREASQLSPTNGVANSRQKITLATAPIRQPKSEVDNED
jgi:hypothetical protein